MSSALFDSAEVVAMDTRTSPTHSTSYYIYWTVLANCFLSATIITLFCSKRGAVHIMLEFYRAGISVVMKASLTTVSVHKVYLNI